MAPVLTQRHSPSPHAQQDTETQAIQQHNREATVLKIQAKYGTITPQGQERLTFLQAKMADDTQRKLDVGDRTHQNISNSSSGDVSATPPERNTKPPIQAKLTIGQPGDKYEQEADRVAAQVVNQIHAPTTQREALPEEDELQMKPEIGSIQRQTMSEELQMKSSGAGMTAPQDLETSIQQARGSGQPLAEGIKQPMEQAFGVSFNGVKIHTDTRSHQLNQSIQARAFTTGQDVFFRQGEYNPGSRGGQELIAHELTHVVQQNGGAVQRSPSDGNGLSPSPAIALRPNSVSIQRRPMSTNEGNKFIDPDYPLLKLVKPLGARHNEYQIEGTDSLIYYEHGLGWFNDYDCIEKADVAQYQGNPDEREGVSNNGGLTYYYQEEKHTGSFLPIMEASKLASDLNREKGQTFDDTKVQSIAKEIAEKRTIYPIEVTQGENGLRLVQGRHRIAASALKGMRKIPYNVV
ncbi:DUF4157 domain-containing protein [Chroococcidiopsis sp. SAG 2025]|uniref:eCIS core domain-containing protein n=1 Tax=Chroococcidiopsis sp. SAG 2025 TaxID=171389 RepID=UPI002936FC32|nr:DUF4157 domain-containing protein [Chroococcidiopsis sp. SAG 2025]